MDDVHFVLRHALSGAILVLFVMFGWWVVDPVGLVALRGALVEDLSATVTVALALFPVIGVTLQGVRLFILSHGDHGLFRDRARSVVAEAMRRAFADIEPGELPLDAHEQALLDSAPDDSFFVWLYHREAPNDLIEWARRRRSYYYLGINWGMGGLAGFVLGTLAPDFLRLPHPAQAIVMAVAAVVWGAGALWAGRRMRTDVDSMEYLWSAARVRPQLRARLNRTLGALATGPAASQAK